jgi:hypothetical protein
MKTFKTAAAVLGLIAFITIVLAIFKLPGVELKKARVEYEVQNPESQILGLEQKIMEDREILSHYPIFRGSKGEKDAGPFLNPLVSFLDKDKGQAKLALPVKVRDELKTKDWINYHPDFKSLNLDFSWMKKLHEFEYWAPEFHNPLIDPKKRPMLSTLPLPFYGDLIQWAKLRLIYGLEKKDLPEALTDVHQLARLIFTNDFLLSSMVTVNILRNETRFLKKYRPSLISFSEDHLERAKRYFYGMPQFVDPRLSDETYRRFSETSVGQCQMISEGVIANHLLRDELKSVYPDEVKRFDETMKSTLSSCRKSLVHLLWEDPQWKAIPERYSYEDANVKPENDSNWKWIFLKVFPEGREILALHLQSIWKPNFLGRYEKSEVKSE